MNEQKHFGASAPRSDALGERSHPAGFKRRRREQDIESVAQLSRGFMALAVESRRWLTLSVIFATLVFQGLTLRVVIRALWA